LKQTTSLHIIKHTKTKNNIIAHQTGQKNHLKLVAFNKISTTLTSDESKFKTGDKLLIRPYTKPITYNQKDPL